MIHILRVPTIEYGRRLERVRWCFKCRKRQPHDLVFYKPTDPMSYYGPNTVIECHGCGEDNADFPGTGRDGPRYDFE